ncbi:MAG: cobalamin-dependent protein [Actinomycetia bacterium]|nr:cobalamin-dependent protein [Actinomycetes bacterium]
MRGSSPQKVVLIRPLHGADELEFQEPLGIECLAGALIAARREVTLFDRRLYERQGTLSGFWEDFFASGPYDLVGFSVMTAEDLPDALRMLQRIRREWPETRFMLGGLYVTLAGEALRALVPDGVELVIGEGEGALLGLPFGPESWAPAYRPQLADYLREGCVINLRGARGCPGGCAFCATPGLPPELRSWAGRAIPEIADEIEKLTSFGAIFNFVEDDFGPLSRVEELDAELRARDLRIAYSLQLRGAALAGEDDLEARMARLYDGGFCRLFIGVESLDPRTLRAWRKPLDPEAMINMLHGIERAGIAVHIGYILWHAGSTPEGVRDEVIKLRAQGFFSTKCVFNRMILFAGSALAGGDPHSRWQALSPDCELRYRELTARLKPLYNAWVAGATDLPRLVALAHLTDDDRARRRVEALLEECDALAYAAVVDGMYPDDLDAQAARLAGEIDEVRRAGR